MKNNIFQIATGVTLLVLLLLLSDPFMLWMPPMAAMSALLVIVLLMLVWTGFIMYEKSHDERELLHKMHGGRIAYLLGIAVLTLALFVQGLAHHIDPWIALSLAGMVIGKISAHLYLDTYG